MEGDKSFDEFYAKLNDIVNSAFNLWETIPKPKIVRKMLKSLPKRFHAKITAIEESKDIDKIPLTELVGNLQTYELGLKRIRKSSKSVALKTKSSDTDESSDDEDSKMKSYITRQFKKFIKNANAKGFDKDHRQSSSSQSKSQDKGKKDVRDGGQYIVPSGPKCFRCQGFGYMKQECPTYLKTIGKRKALATTLSDIEPEDDSHNEDDGILNAYIATVNPTEGIVEDVDEEEELVESKFEKMNEQDDIHTAYTKLYKVSEKHENLYRLATKKFSDVELEQEEISTKFDKANQTIGALRFENDFLVEKTKKLETELFQVRAQLERTSSAKLDEMLSLQKSASDRNSLGYDFSSPSIASTSTTVFFPPANYVETENKNVKNELASENVDKGKFIIGAPPKLDEKEIKNLRAKKGNSQKPKQKKQHFCHHYSAARHTQPNCYKWLATQKSNSMIASGDQNQLPSTFAPLGNLLKALMFLSNLNSFNSSPSPPDQGFAKHKGSSKVWKENGSK